MLLKNIFRSQSYQKYAYRNTYKRHKIKFFEKIRPMCLYQCVKIVYSHYFICFYEYINRKQNG
jgi:hypothetical protein